jgi:hypothetical protein
VGEVEEVGGELRLIVELFVGVEKSKQVSLEFGGLCFMKVFLWHVLQKAAKLSVTHRFTSDGICLIWLEVNTVMLLHFLTEH